VRGVLVLRCLVPAACAAAGVVCGGGPRWGCSPVLSGSRRVCCGGGGVRAARAAVPPAGAGSRGVVRGGGTPAVAGLAGTCGVGRSGFSLVRGRACWGFVSSCWVWGCFLYGGCFWFFMGPVLWGGFFGGCCARVGVSYRYGVLYGVISVNLWLAVCGSDCTIPALLVFVLVVVFRLGHGK
jgi:hypothetical protein